MLDNGQLTHIVNSILSVIREAYRYCSYQRISISVWKEWQVAIHKKTSLLPFYSVLLVFRDKQRLNSFTEFAEECKVIYENYYCNDN